MPQKPLNQLRKEEAFQTLAVADIETVSSRGDITRPSDAAVKEARDWVNYDEM